MMGAGGVGRAGSSGGKSRVSGVGPPVRLHGEGPFAGAGRARCAGWAGKRSDGVERCSAQSGPAVHAGDQEVRKRIVGQLDGRTARAAWKLSGSSWRACARGLDGLEHAAGAVRERADVRGMAAAGRRQPAEDVVFDAFYELAMTGKEIKSVRGWLRTYVDRRAVSAYRRSWREVWAADPHELMPVLQGSPAEQAEGELAARRTWQDVKRLLTPEEQLLITRLADGRGRATRRPGWVSPCTPMKSAGNAPADGRAPCCGSCGCGPGTPVRRTGPHFHRGGEEGGHEAGVAHQSVVDKVTQHLGRTGRAGAAPANARRSSTRPCGFPTRVC
ncbi:hypothetical protein SAMN05216482_9259 [Streptomyces sp. PAN_FS17]|nr:hypothetical protein SAMN05216482_9259 [Streptomyces sp. PAN_FS17]